MMFRHQRYSLRSAPKQFDLFLVLPEEVLDIIFSYVNCADILNLSLVSKRWYEIIGRLPSCMKKLRIAYSRQRFLQGKACCLDSLLKSSRQYRNIRIHYQTTGLTFGPDEKKVTAILRKFAGTIRHILTSNDLQRVCEFPRLKEINLSKNCYRICPSLYSKGLFSKVKDAERVSIFYDFNAIVKKQIIRHLKSASRLITLSTFCNLFVTFGMRECKFKLKRFYYYCDSNTHPYLYEFLGSQKVSLVMLGIKCILTHEHLELILTRMPNLNALSLASKLKYPSLNTLSNSSVMYLSMQTEENMIAFLPHFTNVRILKVEKIGMGLLRQIRLKRLIRHVIFDSVDDNVSHVNRQLMKNDPFVKFVCEKNPDYYNQNSPVTPSNP